MFKIFCFCVLVLLVGCGYTQPGIHEPHGIVHPLGMLRITQIDGQRTVDLTGDYIFRIVPGPHELTLENGHNNSTPVEGTNSYVARFPIDIQEGKKYYLKAHLNYGLNNLFFGVGFQEVKSWRPVIDKEEHLRSKPDGNQDFPPAKTTPQEKRNTGIKAPDMPETKTNPGTP